jgi:PilZ domain
VEIANRCSTPGCDQRPCTVFELRQMCLEHFISTCYEKLEAVSKDRHVWSFEGPEWESASHSIQECAQRAGDLSQQKSEISNLERARLLDIVLWAAELAREVRRSPRSTLAITVRLISERPGRSWEEETHTLDLSRHGARMKCQHAVKNADILKVVRIDTGKQMKARVVWLRQIVPGTQEIGIEFIDGDNTIEA